MADNKRSRDAGTGGIVSAKEAKARPKETVTEKAGRSLEKRVAILEQVLANDGGRLGDAFRNLSR